MVRLIALDLDDTLLRSDLTISFYTRGVVKKLLARGIAVVLASGRTPHALFPFVRKLGLHKKSAYLICENGSLIQDSVSGEVFDEAFIPSKTAMTAYKLADAEGFSVQKYSGEVIYISRRNEFTDYDKKLTGLRQIVSENFEDVVESGCRKLLIPGDPLTLRPLEELLRTLIGEEATLFTSKPYFLEVLPPHVDKGSALAKIAQRLDISREEVMAFGDSMNDEAMLRWAGRSVAMRNADPRIKAITSETTDRTNNDDGAARYIAKHVLK